MISPKKPTRQILLWLVSVVFLLFVYWDGLQCWFIADDFAWLGLLRQYHSPADLLSILFAPAAQGTIRPWSERGFFLLFHAVYGLDSLPFHVAAFVTMCANLALLAWVAKRLTGSEVAGLVASVVWIANAAVVTPMSWSSSYNELQCSLFLLAALALFIRYADTGSRPFWWAQLLVFVLGFGALEINIVYPALAAAWVIFVVDSSKRRALLLRVVPLVVISIAYFVIHRMAVSFPTTGPYALHLDARVFKTVALYGKWTLLPQNYLVYGQPKLLGRAILALCLAALAVLFAADFRQGKLTAFFGLAWYAACLAPVIPLPDHYTDYYLTIPLIGLSLVAASAFGPQRSRRFQALARSAVLLYLVGMLPVTHAATRWWRLKTGEIRALVLGVEAARESHPGKTILIDGMSAAMFGDSVGQGAMYAAGFDSVYLTPGSEKTIVGSPDLEDVERAVLDPSVTLHALRSGEVVVYSFAGDHLRNITAAYERSAPDKFGILSSSSNPLPTRVDVGNPLYSWLLGSGWMPSNAGDRWMTATASVRLKIPQTGNNLLLEGYFTEEQLKQSPRHLVVQARILGSAEPSRSIVVGETRINDPEVSFHRLFRLPAAFLRDAAGADGAEFEIRVDPVTRKDGQEYGVVFGKIAILP